jgi:hypothetical protein
MRNSLVMCAVLVVLSMLTSTCSSSKPIAVPSAAAELWGELKPVVSVKELMRDMIDPLSDNIFDAVGAEITAKGTVETAPKTDEDWAKVRIGAVTLAEGIYLLKIPRPFAPPGDENNSVGPDAPELSPAQIKAKLDADPVLWNAKIEALRNVGLEILEIVNKKDVKGLFDAGGDLDAACEACHLEFWYPGEKTLLPKLRRRLEEIYPPEVKKPVVSHRPTISFSDTGILRATRSDRTPWRPNQIELSVGLTIHSQVRRFRSLPLSELTQVSMFAQTVLARFRPSAPLN